jgi:xanthine dehydrogenase FAD-binding subunit
MVADPMTLWQKYHIATSVDDAVMALANAPRDTQIIGGGTDLLLDMQQGRHAPVHTLVDITQVPEMRALEIRADEIFIGASVPHKKITTSPLIQEHCAALATASGLIGGPQVRNTATIGGNVAHALPAADGTIALMALDAQAEIADTTGTRRVPLAEVFAGPGKNTLKSKEEILTGFWVRLSAPGQSSAFKRIMRPQGVAIAILNLAVWLHREGENIQDVRIAVGPSGPIPRRMFAAEETLKEKTPTPKVVESAYQALLGEANFRTSKYRATKEYRQKMVGVLLRDTLQEAYERSNVVTL